MRPLFFFLFISVTAFAQNVARIPYGNNPKAGKYINHDGVKIYYETYGQGKPMVLIHGNGGSIKDRSRYLEEFSKTYRVIMMDNRCHGKSDCPSGPLTYEQMNEDLNYLLASLHVDSAFVWGHSDGGIVGLLLAIHHGDKVKKFLASGANLRPDTTAVDPATPALLDKMYETVKNDSVKLKQFKLLKYQPNIPVTDLHKIKCDVLIMAGDRDVIRNEHTLEIFNNIHGALLCILPGTTHFVSSQRPEWFLPIATDFFAKPPFRKTTIELMAEEFK